MIPLKNCLKEEVNKINISFRRQMKTRILITDDELHLHESLLKALNLQGYEVDTVRNREDAFRLMQSRPVNLLLADRDSSQAGKDFLRRMQQEHPDTRVVLMSQQPDVDSAVEAIKLGAYDYISKPVCDQRIGNILVKLAAKSEKKASDISDGKAVNEVESFHNVIGQDPKMREIFSLIEAIADSASTVLIYGESGTGKRMIAQAVHQADKNRSGNPFIEVSCGALPETLLESELFGHVRGSFTGAIKDRAGRFELAHGGTLLLDEIDTCSPSLQVKLLRVLEDGNYERVGDVRTLRSDVRIIAATNQVIEELVAKRAFREDLFWRLNVINIHIPPLRERSGDIPLLARHFLVKYGERCSRMRKRNYPRGFSEEAMRAMINYRWPGNIRELENTIERACILNRSNLIELKDLPDSLRYPRLSASRQKAEEISSLKEALRDPEKDIVIQALTRLNWNCSRTAEHLGVNRTTLYNKMKTYGIRRPGGGEAS